MKEIQDVALDLFIERGYRDVSVEQVAAAAGVSPSTVYRYFGGKEMLVVWDDLDPQILELVAAAGSVQVDPNTFLTQVTAGARLLIAALLAAGDEDKIKRRLRLMASESDIRAGQRRQVEFIATQVCHLIAGGLGLDDNDLLPRMVAAQSVWGISAAIDHWVASDFAEPLGEVLDRAIDMMNRSLAAIVVPG